MLAASLPLPISLTGSADRLTSASAASSSSEGALITALTGLVSINPVAVDVAVVVRMEDPSCLRLKSLMKGRTGGSSFLSRHH